MLNTIFTARRVLSHFASSRPRALRGTTTPQRTTAGNRTHTSPWERLTWSPTIDRPLTETLQGGAGGGGCLTHTSTEHKWKTHSHRHRLPIAECSSSSSRGGCGHSSSKFFVPQPYHYWLFGYYIVRPTDTPVGCCALDVKSRVHR